LSGLEWSDDSQHIAIVTTAGPSEQNLANRTYVYDLATQGFRQVSEGYSKAVPVQLEWSPNGDLAQSFCGVQGFACELAILWANGQRTDLVDIAQGITQAGLITWVPRGWLQIPGVPGPISSCEPTFTISDGDTSALISAITAANGTPEPDTICLANNGNYVLNSDLGNDTGLPLITSDITIEGNNATLARDVVAPNFRLIQVDDTGTLTLNDLTLSNGDDNNSGGGPRLDDASAPADAG
jgi:hypothetical protein